MHTSPTRHVSRWAALAAVTVALLGASGAAHAGGGVYWAVNVDAPLQGMGRVGTTFSNTPRGLYGPAPVVIAPPVVYAPQPVYVQPAPVYVEGRRCPPRWGHHHGDEYWGWQDDRRDAYRHGYSNGYGKGYGNGYGDGRRDGRWDGRRDGRGDGRYAWGGED